MKNKYWMIGGLIGILLSWIYIATKTFLDHPAVQGTNWGSDDAFAWAMISSFFKSLTYWPAAFIVCAIIGFVVGKIINKNS